MKTVSEFAKELDVSRQYLYRVLKNNKIGNKIGNKTMISETDEKVLKSIFLKEKDKKMETKLETKTETSFQLFSNIFEEQLRKKDKEIDRLHQLLDQSQQLLLNEQNKNRLALETKDEENTKLQEKIEDLEDEVFSSKIELQHIRSENSENLDLARRAEKLFWISTSVAITLFAFVGLLVWLHFFR